jgi:hypothetical protein
MDREVTKMRKGVDALGAPVQQLTERVEQLEEPLTEGQRSMRPLKRAASRVGRMTRRRGNGDQIDTEEATTEEEEAA